MKKIHEMTDQEILALDSEALENLVKVRYAEEGVKLMSLPTPIEKKEYKGDLKFYEVNGVYFKTFEDAEIFAAAMRPSYKLEYVRNNYSLKFAVPVGEFETKIDTVMLFSEDFANTISHEKKRYDEAVDAYKTAKQEYDTNYNEAQWIRDEIYGKYDETRAKYSRLNDLRARYQEYLSLAENNPEIAISFLTKAYGSLEVDELEYIKSNE